MKIVLIGAELGANLAVGYLLAAVRAAGHDATAIDLLEDRDVDEVAAKAAALRPDLIGLSVAYQSRARGFVALAAALRRAGYRNHLTAGGQLASVAPEALLRDCSALDSIVCGEGEDALPALCRALKEGGDLAATPGLVARASNGFARGPRPEKRCDLDALPFPARDAPLARHLGLPTASLVASRGCRGHCTFCSIAAFNRLSRGPARRERTPENVAREIAWLARERGARVFAFEDDDFLCGDPARDRERVGRLGEALRRAGVPDLALSIKARPDDVDAASLEALRELGLVQVFLGVETSSARGLRALGRGVDAERIRGALRTLHGQGVHVSSNLLLWNPGTTLEDLGADVAFLGEFPDQLFNLTRTEPYEGAPLTLQLAREGRLLGDLYGRTYRVADGEAQLAWELFRARFGARCYSADGANSLATLLGFRAGLAERFSLAGAARLARQARALVARLARDNRAALRELLDLAAASTRLDVRTARALAAGLAAEGAREEDRWRRVLLEALDDLEALAFRAPRSPAPSLARAPLAMAVAGALACSGASCGHGGSTARAESGTLERHEQPRPAAPPPARIGLYPLFEIRGGGCGRAGPAQRLSVNVELDEGAGTLEAVSATEGVFERLVIAPNGRRATGVLHQVSKAGKHAVIAKIRAPDGALTEHSGDFYLIAQQGLSTEPPRPPERNDRWHRAPGCDPVPPPPPPPWRVHVLEQDGPFVFDAGDGHWSGWGTDYQLRLGLEVKGRVLGVPEPVCEQGEAQVGEVGPGSGPRAPYRTQFLVRYVPWTPEQSRLREGTFACTFRVRLGGTKGREQTLEGRLHVHVRADGTVTLGSESDPAKTPPPR